MDWVYVAMGDGLWLAAYGLARGGARLQQQAQGERS